jgi:hypothetical protein
MGVLGDPRGRCCTMHWFGSLGVEWGEPGLGTWDDETLTIQRDEPGGGGHARYLYRLANGRLLQTLQISADGTNWTTFLESDFGPE